MMTWLCFQWFTKKQKRALYDALDKVKAGKDMISSPCTQTHTQREALTLYGLHGLFQ